MKRNGITVARYILHALWRWKSQNLRLPYGSVDLMGLKGSTAVFSTTNLKLIFTIDVGEGSMDTY